MRRDISLLKSRFLTDIGNRFLDRAAAFRAERDCECTEDPADTLLAESIELLVSNRYGNVYLYQTLTVWGDQIATFAIRESVKKRLYRVVTRIAEFPLIATPDEIVEEFWWTYRQLPRLDNPPGKSESDRTLLAEIGSRWISVSHAGAH